MRIVIDCNLFMQTSHAYYLEDNSNTVSNIETIGNNFLVNHIASRANALDVKYIGIQGIAQFCESIKEQLEEKIIAEYGNTKIEIEVI